MDFKKKDDKTEKVVKEDVEEKPKTSAKTKKKVVVDMVRKGKNARGQWEWEEVYE